MLGVAALGAVVLLAGCSPSDLYVDERAANCSDDGAGTSSQPYCSIKKAATVATAGQNVMVSTGTYGGDISLTNSGTSTAPIVFRPAPGANVTVIGGTNGFLVSNRSWVTIQGFSVTQSTSAGIYASGSSNIVLDGNDVSGAGQPQSGETSVGIKLSGTTSTLVINNITHDNSDHGIYLLRSTDNQVVANTSYGNARRISRAAEGIFLFNSARNTVASNFSHDNEDSGIGLWNSSNDNVVINNVVLDNGDHGIDMLRSTGETVVSNTVARSVDSGIELQGGSGARLANNISVDNGINSPRTAGNIRVVDSVSASQVTMDSDLVNLSSGSILIDYLGVKYSSLAAFTAATGHEAHGLQADPRFADLGAGNVALTAGSPAIDSADSGAPAQTATDAIGQARTDDPATANTGLGPRSFDDRGALEYPG